MAETGKELTKKTVVKPIGIKMVKLIEDIQSKFNELYGFSPPITETTDMIAEAIRKKGIRVV